MTLDDDLIRALLDIATFTWLLGWALLGLRDILSGRWRPVSFLFLPHFVFCGVPLLLDHVVGPPNCQWPGYQISAADGLTNLVYCAYVSMCPVLWWWIGRRRGPERPAPGGSTAAALLHLSWQGKTLLHLALFSPLIALWASPNPRVYLDYAAVIGSSFAQQEAAFHPILAACTLISAIAGASLLISQRMLKLTCAYVLPVALLGSWVNGKRAVVLIVCVMFAIALWSRGALTKRGAVVAGGVMAIAFAAFSMLYQGQFRRFNELEWSERYTNLRLDYGREHVIRTTLYAELHHEAAPILEYRLQSLVFDAAMMVPREVWPGKPWPYSVYATAAAFHIAPHYLGWGVTTSWLEEAVANMSWAGLLVGPLLIGWICRVGDSPDDTILRLLTILISSLLLAVQVGAFAPLVVIWAAALFSRRRRAAPAPPARDVLLPAPYAACHRLAPRRPMLGSGARP
jgi:hypothetical protein